MSTLKKPRRSSTPQRVYQLHVELEYLEPAIWRRLWVPDTLTLDKLDRVIQTAMGWKNAHLHAFTVGQVRYAASDPDWSSRIETRDERLCDLAAVLADGTGEFIYTYDFGDDWRHTITIEAIADADPAVEYPHYIDGAGRAPPEDVGGIPGFELFLDAIADPKHEQHRELKRWHGRPFDPAHAAEDEIQPRMQTLARRRALGKAGFEKSRSQAR